MHLAQSLQNKASSFHGQGLWSHQTEFSHRSTTTRKSGTQSKVLSGQKWVQQRVLGQCAGSIYYTPNYFNDLHFMNAFWSKQNQLNSHLCKSMGQLNLSTFKKLLFLFLWRWGKKRVTTHSFCGRKEAQGKPRVQQTKGISFLSTKQ